MSSSSPGPPLFFGKKQSTWLGRPRQRASRNQSFPVSGMWLSVSVRIHFMSCLEDSASVCQDGPSYNCELKPHLFLETFPGGKEPWAVLVDTMTGHRYTPGFLSPKRSVLILHPSSQPQTCTCPRTISSLGYCFPRVRSIWCSAIILMKKKIPQVQSVAINSNRDTAKCFPCLPIKGLGNPHCFFRLSWQDSQLLIQNTIPLKGFTKRTKVVRCGQVSLWASWGLTFSFGKE